MLEQFNFCSLAQEIQTGMPFLAVSTGQKKSILTAILNRKEPLSHQTQQNGEVSGAQQGCLLPPIPALPSTYRTRMVLAPSCSVSISMG